jgi:hypothetical protein
MKKNTVPGLLLVLFLLVMAGGCTNPVGSAKDATASLNARKVTLRETGPYGVVHEKGVLV